MVPVTVYSEQRNGACGCIRNRTRKLGASRGASSYYWIRRIYHRCRTLCTTVATFGAHACMLHVDLGAIFSNISCDKYDIFCKIKFENINNSSFTAKGSIC